MCLDTLPSLKEGEIVFFLPLSPDKDTLYFNERRLITNKVAIPEMNSNALPGSGTTEGFK